MYDGQIHVCLFLLDVQFYNGSITYNIMYTIYYTY